jgi:hypothetical protein
MKSMWWKLFKTQASTIEAAIDPWFAIPANGVAAHALRLSLKPCR